MTILAAISAVRHERRLIEENAQLKKQLEKTQRELLAAHIANNLLQRSLKACCERCELAECFKNRYKQLYREGR